MKYIKLFNEDSEYQEYISGNADLPNVSHCITENHVHYNPWVETRLIGTFNVTSTSSATNIMFSSATSQFSEIEIDGVVQPSVVSAYTFDTIGEHTVKYTLSDPTSIGQGAFSHCIDLTSVTIPSGVTSIGYSAFQYCSNLSTITSHIMNAPSVNSGTFGYAKNGGTLYVPIGSSGYETWMNDQGNLGLYNWTKVEQ